MPNAVLIAKYCKLFGLEPALQLGISSNETGPLRMAINYACYIAHSQSENEDYTKAQDKNSQEAFAMDKFIEELKEASTSRG